MSRAAAQDHIDLGPLNVLTCNFALVSSMRNVRGKGSGSRISDLAGADESDRTTRSLGKLQDRRLLPPFGIDRDGAIVCFHSCGDSRSGRGGVGDERRTIRRRGAHLTEMREPVHRESAIATGSQQLGGKAVRLSHAVSDQQDHIAGRKPNISAGKRLTSHECLELMR